MIAALLALGISIISIYELAPWLLSGHQWYPEFVAGLIGFEDYNKTGEGNLFKAGLLLYFILLPLLNLPFRTFRSPKAASSFQIGTLVFIGILSGRAVFKGSFSPWIIISIVLAAALSQIKSERVTKIVVRVLLSAPITFLSSLGILTLLASFSLYSNSGLETARLTIIFCCFLTAGIIGLLEVKKINGSYTFFQVIQLPSIFIVTRLLNIAVIGPSGTVPFDVSTGGKTIVYILVAAAIFATGTQLLKRSRDPAPFVGWPLLVSAGFVFAYGYPSASTLNVDDFHLGEMLLPWHQVMQQGMKPYTDFVPVQGLIGLSIGAINNIFYHGTIATFTVATVILNCLCCISITLLTASILGPTTALLLAPLALPSLDRFYLTTVIFLILAHPYLLQRLRLWFATASVLGAIGFFWNAPSTIAFTAASSPMCALFLIDTLRSKKDSAAKVMFHLFWPAAVILLLASLFLPLYGVFTFVWENGYINTVQHASKFFETWEINPSFPQYFSSRHANRIAWELIRVGGWVLGSCLLYVMVVAAFQKHKSPAAYGFYLLALGGILFSLILFPYSMGRIDPPLFLSRPGVVSMMVLSFFIPVTFLYAHRYLNLAPVPSLIIGFMAGLPIGVRGYTFTALLEIPSTQVAASSDFALIDGNDVGIPLFGHGYAPRGKLAELASFKQALDRVLRQGETYADLTNHSVYYALLNLPNPYLYPSANAVGSRIQKRILDKYESLPPSVVFVYPMIEIDRASQSLRNYLLFRWFMKHKYHLVSFDNFGFLLSPHQFEKSGLPEASEKEWVRVFSRSSLSGLPRAWGRSFNSLRHLVSDKEIPIHISETHNITKEKEGWLTIAGNEPFLSLSLQEPIQGDNFDYLLIRLERLKIGIKKPQLSLSLLNDSPEKPLTEFTFWGYPDTLIIPVSSSPEWFRRQTTGFKLSFGKENPGASWRIKSMKLLTLR